MKQKQVWIVMISIFLSLNIQAKYYIKTLTHDSGNCTGKIEVVAEGMTEPFSYKWSNGSEEKTIDKLCAGTYEVEIFNKYACSKVLQVEILKQPESKSFSNFTKTDACKNFNNGSATISIVEETQKALRLQWDNGNTKTTRNNLAAGEHCYNLYKTTIDGEVLVERKCIAIVTGPNCKASDQLIYLFKVHPNPFSENLTIEIERASNQPAFGTLFIYNTAGKEVMRKKLQLKAGHNSLTLPVDSELPNGVYNIRYHEKGMKQPKTTQIIKIN